MGAWLGTWADWQQPMLHNHHDTKGLGPSYFQNLRRVAVVAVVVMVVMVVKRWWRGSLAVVVLVGWWCRH